ncbi:MAG TPA: ABC transporter substrate-binding protein [Caulobacteraceae bacterium]|jgi:phospholipid transport system substrate-binding protein|nr:ABC transporter substrate-binding protein [Caulobacteraceae bacterium]
MVSHGLRTVLGVAAAAALVLAAAVPVMAASDPAASQIETLEAHTLSVMKEGKSLGFHGRYTRMKPFLEQALDLPVMTRFAVGPAWSTMTEAQHQALVAAFTRMIVSTYAHNFDGYSGEKFEVGAVDTRGVDKLVHVKLVQPSGKAVNLTYRMRQSGPTWKVIDVYYQGSVSELTTRRSDFSATLAKGGEPALVEHLNALSEKLAK